MATVLGLDGCAVECVHPDKVRLVTENAPRPEEIAVVASVFKLLGDPTRAKLLYALLEAGELCETCSTCQGRGTVKSAETVCYEIFREILREARSYENDTLLVLAAQSVVDRLLDEESGNVADLEEFIGKTIRFQVETLYTQEQYDVVLL